MHQSFSWVVVMCLVALRMTELPCSSATSVSFYVSPLGNDTHTGTSADAPWQTLGAASARLSSLVNTSWSLYLARNQSWIGGDVLSINLANVAGAVSIAPYGHEHLPQPILVGVRGAVTTAPLVSFYGFTQHVTSLSIRGLLLYGSQNGIVLTSMTPGVTARNITITDCAFMDFRRSLLEYSPADPRWAPAILFAVGTFHVVTIHHLYCCSH